jgi:hypothetical protein
MRSVVDTGKMIGRYSENEEGGLTMFVVRIEGLEPTRPCGHRNLNPARLPIPPYPLLFGHNLRAQCSTNLNVCSMHNEKQARS